MTFINIQVEWLPVSLWYSLSPCTITPVNVDNPIPKKKICQRVTAGLFRFDFWREMIMKRQSMPNRRSDTAVTGSESANPPICMVNFFMVIGPQDTFFEKNRIWTIPCPSFHQPVCISIFGAWKLESSSILMFHFPFSGFWKDQKKKTWIDYWSLNHRILHQRIGNKLD